MQVGLHSPSVTQYQSLQYLVHSWLLVGYHPIQATSRSGVLEGGSGRGTAHRRGVVAVGVERRVQVDEVDRRGVEAAQDVPGPDGSVGEVGHLAHMLHRV